VAACDSTQPHTIIADNLCVPELQLLLLKLLLLLLLLPLLLLPLLLLQRCCA
jgi:hypothetical protein